MNRRDFIKAASMGALATALPSYIFGGDTTRKKNILFIPVDDLKPLLGCYGEKQIHSPNIDRLAARGTVFTNAQCQQAVCGPSRASIMTGLYPDTTGVHDLKTRMRDINPDVLTLPQHMRQNGYTTCGIGKTFDFRCVDKMLDKPSWSIPYKGHNDFIYSPNHPKPTIYYQNPKTREIIQKIWKETKEDHSKRGKMFHTTPGGQPPTECMDLPDDAYSDGAIANRAVKLLEELSADDKPFFFSTGFIRPHLPFVAPKKYWDLYDRSKIKLAENQNMPRDGVKIAYQPGWELRNGYSDVPKDARFNDDFQKELIHGYYACISYMDAQVGRLLDTLERLKIADSTIICLWGDHGWHLGDHNMWCKHSNFEQAVRSPLIIADPDQKQKGTKVDSPVGFVDVFPTLCDLTNLDIPKHLQGKSLKENLSNPKLEIKKCQMSQYPRNSPETPELMGYSLRTKRYRYTEWLNREETRHKRIPASAKFVELYDYQNDPHEFQNLANKPETESLRKEFATSLRKEIANGMAKM